MGKSGGTNLSLKKSAFLKLLLITIAAVLLFYGIGLSFNAVGIRNVRSDMQRTLNMRTDYLAGQIDQDFDNLNFFALELMSYKELLRFALTNRIMDDYQRMACIRSIAAEEYMIKRSSSLVQEVRILLPGLKRTIVTDKTEYSTLDEEMFAALLDRAEKGRVRVAEWDNCFWMLLPRYDRREPLFLIAIAISPDTLLQRMSVIASDGVDGVLLLRKDGSEAGTYSEAEGLRDAFLSGDNNILTAEADLRWTGLTLRSYSRIDPSLTPFVHYRRNLWILTAAALALMGIYLMYFRLQIMRPINDIFNTMQQAGQDGHYRIDRRAGSDYDDIYARFNDMVEHIEELASQVYEERYRAQQAELKQLQIQIDPHFLYNSLYSVYRIARAEGNESIAKLSLHLSDYYRYITKMPAQIVPLRDEIRHVTNYLEIQRMRFEPRIHIEIEPLPEEIAGEMIPSLIIQPIVENAFEHGVRDMAAGGLVTLRYEVLPDCFRVIMADNSGRMTEEKVEMLRKRISDPESDDPNALRNLYRRLQLYENSDHALELKSVENGMTAVLTFRRRGQN